MTTKFTALALMVTAGTAVAQPGAFTDLGARTSTQTFTQDVTLLAANDVQWFRIELPMVNAAGGWVDIWTSTPGDITDTEIGLYDSTGAGAGSATTYNDDDSGPGLFSQLTFGAVAERDNLGNGALARNGSDGWLNGGVYYLAFARFNVTFAPDFAVTSAYTGAQRTATLNFDIDVPTTSFPPVPVVSVNHASVVGGMSLLLTARVAPGGLPASTGLTAVADLSPIGGSATQALFDNGANGDATVGDGTFSFAFTVPGNAPLGPFTVNVTASDAQGRSGSGSASSMVAVAPEATDLGVVGGANTITHTLTFAGPDEIKWLKFRTLASCDPVTNFLDIDNEGSVITGTGTFPDDTEIGLYTEGGVLIASDDDSGSGVLSQLTFGATGNPRPAVGNGGIYNGADGNNGSAVVAGTYYLAAGIFNLNFTSPFGVAHTASVRTTDSAGTMNINFNTNLPPGGPVCGAADLGGVGGVPGADNHLDNNDFVVFIDFFFNHNPLADQGSTGGAPGADGVWDNNDFVVFIDNFFNAPASCR